MNRYKFTIIAVMILTLVFGSMTSFAAASEAQASAGFDNAASAYLDLLGNIQYDILKINDIFRGDDVKSDNVILEDITGDQVPELIYSTIEDEAGSSVITMQTSLEYTHKIVNHIVTFDAAKAQIIPLMDTDTICFDDAGNYTHFGIWPVSFYSVSGSNNLYSRLPVSWSGLAVNIAGYTFDEGAGTLTKTSDILVGPSDLSEEEIENEEMKSVFRQDENTKLVFDAYGNSDCRTMSVDEAITYLKTADLAADFGQDQIEDVLVVNTPEQIPENLEDYKKAYITLLLGFNNYISSQSESGSMRRAAVSDVYGDDLPELIVVMDDPEGSGHSDLYIFTYMDGSVVQLYRSAWDDVYDADRYYYYLFKVKDDKTLYVYKNTDKDGWLSESIFWINAEGSENDNLLLSSSQNYAVPEGQASYYRYYTQITEWDYMMAQSDLLDRTDEILMINYSGGDFDDNYAAEHENHAMTCMDAVNYLINSNQ